MQFKVLYDRFTCTKLEMASFIMWTVHIPTHPCPLSFRLYWNHSYKLHREENTLCWTEHNSPTSFHSDSDDVRGYILLINALDWCAQANNSSKWATNCLRPLKPSRDGTVAVGTNIKVWSNFLTCHEIDTAWCTYRIVIIKSKYFYFDLHISVFTLSLAIQNMSSLLM